jgi:hypothetical protein
MKVTRLSLLGGLGICCCCLITACERQQAQVPLKPDQSFNAPLYRLANQANDPTLSSIQDSGLYQYYSEKAEHPSEADHGEHESFFVGTTGNDVVSATGKNSHVHVIGIPVRLSETTKAKNPDIEFISDGFGQTDTLIAAAGSENEFLLGTVQFSPGAPKAKPLYVGKGNRDFALIRGFKQGRDALILAGTPGDYTLIPSDQGVEVQTKSGDRIAIVQGVTALKPGMIVKENGIFILR